MGLRCLRPGDRLDPDDRRHFGRQNTTGAKIGWIVAVLIVPYLGAIVYWIVRKPDAGSAEQAYQLEAERQARARGH